MTADMLRNLAKPICDALGVDTVDDVTSIILTPTDVYVEFYYHGQRRTVTELVTG